MLVQCPSCKTKYKVSDDVVKDTTPAFRCSRCKHTFELELELPRYSQRVERENHLPEFPADEPKEEPELHFSFSNETPSESAQNDQQERGSGKGVRSGAVSNGGEPDPQDHWSIEASEAKLEDTFTIAKEEPIRQEQQISAPATSEPEAEETQSEPETGPSLATSIHSIATVREQRASIVPFLTLFAVLIGAFSFATAYYAVHPQHSEGIVQQIPLLGSSVLKNEHLKENVELQSVQTSYQTIQGNREVFVVTGVALNKNPVVIRDVRIAGQLYSPDGKTMEQQTVWIGNAISLKIVRGMTAQDISDLQRLKPLKSFEMPPGDAVPFTIVFLKAPREAKDFSCTIVSAEAEV
jgi:predicted Zn finger-like uncharacterized protein